MRSWSFSVFCLLLGTSAAASTGAPISISPPPNSLVLSPTLLSFSLEQDRWPDWAGLTSQNTFTLNALTNYARNTGVPPKIRVGANTEDRTRWSASVNVFQDIFPANTPITPYPEASNVTVSDAYYALSKWMPQGTHMIWGLNLGADDAQNAINTAKSILKAFDNGNQIGNTGITLDRLELGNEADLYSTNGLRPATWTVQQYVNDWVNIMTSVVQAIGLQPHGKVSVQGCSFAGQGFTPIEVFNLGLLQTLPGSLITVISQHRYSGAFCTGSGVQLRSFMSKTSIRGNLTVFNADIAATKQRGLPYILGETNSIACHGAPGVSNTAGAALWSIDYTLQSATLGISEVFFHDGIGFKYNFFQPISLSRSPIDDSPLNPPLPPHVQPNYYAGIVITEAVGLKAASGTTEIVEIILQQDNISGYAIYENGSLVRAVFINLNAWLTTDVGVRQRQTTHIDFNFFSTGSIAYQMTVRRLTIGHADDTAGLLYNGQSYEQSADATVTGVPVDTKASVLDGIDIQETEAVMIIF